MNTKARFNLDLFNLRNTLKPKILLGTDSMCTPDAEHSYTSLIAAVYDSPELNYVDSIELQVSSLIINRNEPSENIDASIFLNIPFGDLVSTDTKNAEKLAKFYAAKLQIELIKLNSELFSTQETAYISTNLNNINLEPSYWCYENNTFTTLSAIDWITSENHKFLFATLSELTPKIILEAH